MPDNKKKPKSLLEIAQEDKDFQGNKSSGKSDIDYDSLVKEFSDEPEKKKDHTKVSSRNSSSSSRTFIGRCRGIGKSIWEWFTKSIW